VATIDDLLLPLFAAQHWLVSQDDVRSVGGTRQQVRHRLAIGRWDLADVRVYRMIGMPVTWRSRLLAPVLSAGTSAAAASHFAAAVLHGLPGFGEGTPEISVFRGSGVRRPGVRVHTSTDLDRCDLLRIDGIPTTDLGRTILDIGRTASDRRVLKAIEHGRRTGQTSWSDMILTLHRHARRGRPGVARLRRVLAANVHREEISDSDFELLFIALLLEHGLPEPVLHHRIYAGGRFVAEVDLAYPELKIAIELDGSVHLLPDVHERDLPRQNDLVLEGWTVLRFTYRRVQLRPELVVAEVRAARATRTR
jgi:very-short-patch-repair endonuclease